jgi:3-methyladenine DNA glycosylase/8-oxoguanine DNA glycosylase
MHYDRDLPVEPQWSPDDVAGLVDLAGQMHRQARPYVYDALSQPALVQTVRAFPSAVALGELARSVADDALRRALRAPGAEALAARIAELAAAAQEYVHKLALAQLAADAARELRHLRGIGRPSAQ